MKTLNYKLDSEEITYLCKKDARFAKLITTIGPLSYSQFSDGYTFLVHELIEQMLSKKTSNIIYTRLESLCSGKIILEQIKNMELEKLRTIGISNAKANYIKNLTNHIVDGKIDLNKLANLSNQEVITSLSSIKGIGAWTSKMYLIFVLNRLDILPYEDSAFCQTYKWLYKTTDTSKESVQKNVRNGGHILPLLLDIFT